MAYLRLRRLIDLAVLDRPGLARWLRPGREASRAAPAAEWDSHYERGAYDVLLAPERRYHHHLLAGLIAERRPAARVLEIGCGQGAFYESLRRHGVTSYLGTDIAPRAIDQARARFAEDIAAGRATFEVADGAERGRDGAFDAVIIADCLEYLGPVAETLARCGRLLAPGGVVGVTQWLAAHPLGLWRDLQTDVTVLDEAVVMAPWGGAWQVWTCRPAGLPDA